MAARRSHSGHSQRTQSSQSSFMWRSSSPHTRESSSSPGPETQEVRDEIIALRNQAALARRGGYCNGRVREHDSVVPDHDDMGAERPSKYRKTSPTQPGRGIRKIVDLYHDISDLLNKAKKYTTLLNASELDPAMVEEMDKIDFVGMSEDEIEEERKDRKRCHSALKLLNTLIQGFEQKATAAENTANYCAPLQTGANDARSDDTVRLKTAVAEWLNSRMTETSESYTRLSAKGKDERGINHDLTGRLLCPIDYDWDDEYVRVKLRNADPGYDFTSSLFLRCLYDKETGDPNSPHIGFLKSQLLVLAYRHIFTAPSSASAEKGSEISSRRRDVATTLRLNGRVTPRSIAYTATQLIFSLNSARDWKQEHAGFHYPTFYNFIVDFFEDAEDDISIKELLQWWNSQVFPPTARPSGAAALRESFRSSQRRLQESRAREAQARA